MAPASALSSFITWLFVVPAGMGGTATCGSETLRTESHAGRLAAGIWSMAKNA